MKITLGNMELRQSEKPDYIQRGGGQHLGVFEFAGGNVSVQNFGPKYREVSWSGWFEGKDAYERMVRIGIMRQKGDAVELKTEKSSGMYVISEFLPDHKHDMFIPFTIKLQPIIDVQSSKKDPLDKYIEKLGLDKPVPSKTIMYTVVAGDTLSKIALRFLGDANKYDKIYKENSNILTQGPHLIYPGQVLKIEVD